MNPDRPHASLRRLRIGGRAADSMLKALRDDPGHTAILLDIDGTLAPIVLDPDRAEIPTPTRTILRHLKVEYALLGVVTGRRALNARAIVRLDIEYAGNHGFERLSPGASRPVIDPSVIPWLTPMRDFVSAHCGSGLVAHGVRVEDKELVVTLHWRGTRDEAVAQQAAVAAANQAKAAGLAIQQGRGIVEIKPPVAVDKGTAVEQILAAHPSIRHVIYAGDDVTDVDAMRALAELKASGRLVSIVRVGVGSKEVPAAILANADIVVNGPRGLRRLLHRLDRGVAGPHLPLAV